MFDDKGRAKWMTSQNMASLTIDSPVGAGLLKFKRGVLIQHLIVRLLHNLY